MVMPLPYAHATALHHGRRARRTPALPILRSAGYFACLRQSNVANGECGKVDNQGKGVLKVPITLPIYSIVTAVL